MKYIEDDCGFRTEIIMSNVTFIDKHLDGGEDLKRCRIPIPGIFFQKLSFKDDIIFKWNHQFQITVLPT